MLARIAYRPSKKRLATISLSEVYQKIFGRNYTLWAPGKRIPMNHRHPSIFGVLPKRHCRGVVEPEQPCHHRLQVSTISFSCIGTHVDILQNVTKSLLQLQWRFEGCKLLLCCNWAKMLAPVLMGTWLNFLWDKNPKISIAVSQNFCLKRKYRLIFSHLPCHRLDLVLSFCQILWRKDGLPLSSSLDRDPQTPKVWDQREVETGGVWEEGEGRFTRKEKRWEKQLSKFHERYLCHLYMTHRQSTLHFSKERKSHSWKSKAFKCYS